jgi:predicted nuclease of predicted toxin-antitoxin system
MRLWLDEMIPAEVARKLRDLGHDAQAVQENRWAWGLDDEAQLEAAVRQGRAIVTFNLRDFVPIAQQWAAGGRRHMGIILIHPRTVQADDIDGLVRRLAALLEAHPVQDALADRVEFLS